MTAGVISSEGTNGWNPGALNIELDVQQWPMHQGDQKSFVRIYGLGIQDISQAFNLNGQNAKLEVGMMRGYPLADSSQRGVVVEGTVYQAFGNWIGTDMTVDIIFGPNVGAPDDPKNFTFTWKQGQTLQDLVDEVMKQVFPNQTHDIRVSSQRIGTENRPGAASSLADFAGWVQENTWHGLGSDDDGVYLTQNGDRVTAFESSGEGITGSPTQIRFQDLLGQVTWYAPLQISAKLVMRGDLHIGQSIQFPVGLPSTVTANSLSALGGTTRLSNSIGFANTPFQIFQIQHWGNYRQPDAMSWNTTIWANQLPSTGAAGSTGGGTTIGGVPLG